MKSQIFHAWVALLLACTALSPCQALAGGAPQVAAAAKPDVVFLLVDDLDVAVYQSGLRAGLYPNLKRLLSVGTSFSNAFVSLSICCPSRGTFLTGQYPHNHGTVRNNGPVGGYRSFKDASTLAVWMKAGGYRTALMGKYLNGYNETTRNEVPPGWDTWNALLSLQMYDYAITVNGGVDRHGSAEADYQTDVLARYADTYIRSAGEQPFFLYLVPSAPHLEGEAENGEDDGGKGIRPAPRHARTPTVPLPALGLSSFNEADMSDKPQWMRNAPLADGIFLARLFNEKRTAMRAVDDMVGKLVRALRDTGRWKNTLFVFSSDNGYQYGTHRKSATKVDFYDESSRIPLVIRAPGQTVGRATEGWALNNDWAVTVMAYAGLEPPADHIFDGRSLLPLVSGKGEGRRSLMVELPPTGESSRRPPFFSVRSKDPALTGDPSGQKVMVYAESLDAISLAVTDPELYDLERDPLQLQSLHLSTDGRRIRQMQALSARLHELKACKGAACKVAED